jgi:hypothetical protein
MSRYICFITAVLAMTLGLETAHASGPVALYALVDKVTLEPNADKPERVRVAGVFMVARGQSDDYAPPERGYVYFVLPKEKYELVRRECSDLQSIAGTRQVIGLGSSWFANVRVRKADEEAKSPDAYPIGNGLMKINSDQPRAKALLDYK